MYHIKLWPLPPIWFLFH